MEMQSSDVALLIVDVQKGFIRNGLEHLPEKIESLQGQYHHVFATKFINFEGSNFDKLINWRKMRPFTEQIELSFKLKSGAVEIEKYQYSCVNSEFISRLVINKINCIHIVGLETDVCVLKCAADIFENGFRPVVLKDFCGSPYGEDRHNEALSIIARFIGRGQVI